MKREHRYLLAALATLFAAGSLALVVINHYGYRPIPYQWWFIPNLIAVAFSAAANRDMLQLSRAERRAAQRRDRKLAPVWIRVLSYVVGAGLMVQLAIIVSQVLNGGLNTEMFAWEIFPAAWTLVFVQMIAQQMGALRREMSPGNTDDDAVVQRT